MEFKLCQLEVSELASLEGRLPTRPCALAEPPLLCTHSLEFYRACSLFGPMLTSTCVYLYYTTCVGIAMHVISGHTHQAFLSLIPTYSACVPVAGVRFREFRTLGIPTPAMASDFLLFPLFDRANDLMQAPVGGITRATVRVVYADMRPLHAARLLSITAGACWQTYVHCNCNRIHHLER